MRRAGFLLLPLALLGCVVPDSPNEAETDAAVADAEMTGEAPADEVPASDWSPGKTSPHDPTPGRPQLPNMSVAERQACDAKGGTVDRRGMMQSELCVIPFADAGKVCTDGDECEGRCIAEGQVGAPPGETTRGICQRDDALFGCFGIVENGRIESGLCVD